MAKLFLLLVAFVGLAGCASQKAEPSRPTPLSRCRDRLEQGSVYAGQSESEFLETCGPAEASQVGPLRLYNYVILRGYEGLMVIAKDGKLVRAFHWTDYAPPKVFFDTMTDADRGFLKERTHLD